MQEELFLTIPRRLATTQSADAIYTYAAIQAITNFSFVISDELMVLPDAVAELIFGAGRENVERTVAAMEQLKAEDVLVKRKNGHYYADVDSFSRAESFLKVPIDIYRKFIGLGKARTELFKYYCVVLLSRSAESDYKACTLAQSTLADMTGISSATLIRYNKVLADAKLLYIKHRSPKRLTGDRQTNVFGAYEDKNYIDSFEPDAYAQINANAARKVSAEYNAFVKRGGAGYTAEAVAILRRKCETYNFLVSDDRKKDLSVFDNYLGSDSSAEDLFA